MRLSQLASLAATATAAAAVFLAGVAQAQPAQVSISYGPKAEKALVTTYGNKERDVIADMLVQSLSEAVGAKAARVDVVVNDVVANRPTFKQLGDKSGLSYQSFGIGGADISGKAYDANGALIGDVTYDWYGDIEFASTAWVWSDADRAIRQFSRRLAKDVQN